MALRRHRLPDDLTPEQREQRIAELRAKRRARARKLAIRSAIGAGGALVLAAIGIYWLLMTFGGRDFLLGQVTSRLPAGTTLDWQRAEGPASGPLTLHGMRFTLQSCPDVDGEPVPYGQCDTPGLLVFTANQVTVDPDVRPLFGRLLRLDALDIRGATLDLPVAADEPFELPTWPEVLPQIAPPFALQADAIRVDGFRVTRAGEPLVDIASLRGGLDARVGALTLTRMVVESDRGRFTANGRYAPGDDYATNLTATALLPARPGRTRPRLGLVARGDLAAMDVAVTAYAPERLRALLTLRGREDPRWAFTAATAGLVPTLLTGASPAAEPLAFDLRASGIGGAATLQGRLTQGPLAVVVQPSKVSLDAQVLTLAPLVVDVAGGRVTARGRGDFSDPRDARFRFAVIARGLSYVPAADPDAPDAPAPPAIEADADFGIAGTTAAWAAIGTAAIAREGQQAAVDFDGRGNADAMTLRRLDVAMPSGTLKATGRVGWAPALGWDIEARLAGFDPGYFAPAFPGAINGALTSTGTTRDDGGLDAVVHAADLGGTLRGRRLAGRGHFEMAGAATRVPAKTAATYSGDVDLRLGGSRIAARGTLADRVALDARFDPLQLDDLLPTAAGTLRGTATVGGTRNAPDIALDLTGSGLRYAGYTADTLRAQGRLPWARGDGALALDATGINAGLALDSVSVRASGAVEALSLQADARGGMGTLALAGDLRRAGSGWQGVLETLRLAPGRGGAWQLQAPARFSQAGDRVTLARSCFSSGQGALCAEADWPRQGVAIEGTGLPLALVAPYLPVRDDGRPWVLRGEIAVDASARPAGAAYAGHVRVTSPGGGLRLSTRARRDLVDYSNLDLDATFNAGSIRATLETGFNGQGRIDARIDTGWQPTSPLAGEVGVDISELTWMELFSPDIVEPQGTLQGRITLGGTRAAPALGGQARLSAFTTEVPALGIVLEDGDVRLDARPDGSASIVGSVGSGEGTLRVDGSLGWRGEAGGQAAPLVLNLGGTDVLVSDTRDLRAVASPDLVVRIAAAEPISVTGRVRVPSATIDLERLDQGRSISADVVVLDPVDPAAATAASSLDLDLTLAMGDDVELRGFGLDGTLGGELRVRAQQGREMTATGQLQVGGEYAAYGQKLQVTRGELQWSNSLVDDPFLDIRAEREIEAEDVTAGIDVTGRATAPKARVWSDPATTESEALSYLALGRSTSNLSSEEGTQLNAASAALNAGGSLLASQIGSRIGLDSAGVTESRALGGSVLGIGKKLSPRLYVGFGVSLLGTGQVLTLKYLLRKGFDLEVESSTLESRGSVNWRREK